jgi:hypothetical protein
MLELWWSKCNEIFNVCKMYGLCTFNNVKNPSVLRDVIFDTRNEAKRQSLPVSS